MSKVTISQLRRTDHTHTTLSRINTLCGHHVPLCNMLSVSAWCWSKSGSWPGTIGPTHPGGIAWDVRMCGLMRYWSLWPKHTWPRWTQIHQDNARPHTARITTGHFQQNHVDVMEWPACSPDMNPYCVESVGEGSTAAYNAKPVCLPLHTILQEVMLLQLAENFWQTTKASSRAQLSTCSSLLPNSEVCALTFLCFLTSFFKQM